MSKDQEPLPGESIFIKDQRYRQISNGHSNVAFDLFIETRFLQIIALLTNFQNVFSWRNIHEYRRMVGINEI